MEVAADLSEIGLPDTARAMVDTRLDALPAPERHFLLEASVIGRTFWREAVAEVGDFETEGVDVDALVDRLVDRGLLGREDLDDQIGDLAFRHVVVRDAVYASIPMAERAEKHARIAEWIERSFAGAIEVRSSAGWPTMPSAVTYNRELDRTDPGTAQAAFEHLVQRGRGGPAARSGTRGRPLVPAGARARYRRPPTSRRHHPRPR